MGYQAKQYNKQGRAIAYIHVPSQSDNKDWDVRYQAQQDAKRLHKELEEVRSLKEELKELKDTLKDKDK